LTYKLYIILVGTCTCTWRWTSVFFNFVKINIKYI